MALVGQCVHYTKHQRQVRPPRPRTADQQPEKYSVLGKMRGLANQVVAEVNRRGGDSGQQPSQYRVDDPAGVGGGKRGRGDAQGRGAKDGARRGSARKTPRPPHTPRGAGGGGGGAPRPPLI